MKGLVKYDHGPVNMEVRELPVPELKSGEVRVEIRAAGICGTDIHIYKDEYPYNPPVIMGHEFSGIVDEVADTDEYRPGDAVTGIPTTVVCGVCRYCTAGQHSLCDSRLSIGSGVHGVFTNYVVMPAWALRRIPEHLDLTIGALSEPLCCCVKAVSIRTSVTAGDVAVVTGPGPIGMLTTQVAKAEGAYVILTGTSEDRERLELGAHWADETVNIDEVDLLGLVRDRTQGYGADVIYECSGSAAATRSAIELVRKQGTIMQIGLHGAPFELDFFPAELKEIDIRTSFAGSLDAWDRTMVMLDQRRIELEPIVSDVVPLTEWENAFRRLLNKEGMKILFEPVD